MTVLKLDEIQLPDWSWHLDDREEVIKLTASLMKHGQVLPLLVRFVNAENELVQDGHFEVVDGRRRLNIMRQLGWAECQVHNFGLISKEDAIKLALSLELGAEIDYAKMAQIVTSLEHDDGYASLPMTTPFTTERLRYFKDLQTFDWAQFQFGQVSLYEDDDAPPPPPKVETIIPGEPGKQIRIDKQILVARPAPAQPSATAANDVAARRAARAVAFTPDSMLTPKLAVEIGLRELEAFSEPIVGLKQTYTTVELVGDEVPPENLGWRPEAPPQLDGIDEIELDCETNGLKWWEGAKPIGISVRLPNGKKQYLPWGHTGGNLDEAQVKEWAKRELRGKKITNANTRFDNHMLYAWGIDLEEQGCQLADVQHYAALLDEYRREFKLDVLAKDFIGQHKTGQDLDKTRMAGYHASQVAEYACHDVHLVGELKQVMIPLMDAQDLQRVRQLECDVIYPVCEMERNAANVDRGKLLHFTSECRRMLDEMLFEIARECGFQINPDKNADLVRLFDFLKLAYPGRTEPSKSYPQGQASFADALLAKINHPLVQIVRKSGKLASLMSKFLLPYSEVVGADNALRFALHQLRGDEYGTIRGRFSMSGSSKGIGQFGANLQQVFRVNSQRMAFGFAHDDNSHDSEIFLVRELFEAAPYVRDDESNADHVSADAQSIEYRLAAHFAESEKLISAYKADAEKLERGDLGGKWVDFHKVVGDEIRRYKDLSRNIVKNANFCLVYGGREATLSTTLGMERTESDQIYRIWHQMFPELSRLPKKAENLARSRGFVKTISGRRARFTNADQMQWAHAAINYVIQGSAADIMKAKLVELHQNRKYTGFLMRYTVHDEVDGDARATQTASRMREVLNRQTFQLRVPIVWEVETGPNWAVAH